MDATMDRYTDSLSFAKKKNTFYQRALKRKFLQGDGCEIGTGCHVYTEEGKEE